jgi:hypothetical protein
LKQIPVRRFCSSRDAFIKQAISELEEVDMDDQMLKVEAKDVKEHVLDASTLEDEDFLMSNLGVNIKAIYSEQGEPADHQAGSRAGEVIEDKDFGYDDMTALDRDPTQPKTFSELFARSPDGSFAQRASPELSASIARGRINDYLYQLEDVKRRKNLEKGKAIFFRLFAFQSTLAPEHEVLHMVCRDGWRTLLSMYIQLGSYEELSTFLDSYSAIYGLHDSDRLICLLKYFLRQDMLDIACKLLEDAGSSGLGDERGYTILARKFSTLGQANRACSYLDQAWAKALEHPDFKITATYYEAAAEVYIRAGRPAQLQELLERINANKPAISSRFYERAFMAINSVPTIEAEALKVSEKAQSDEPSPQPTQISEQYENPGLSIAIKTEMFRILEQSMLKRSIRVTTTLKNELIFFKLHTISDPEQLFTIVGQYVATPDVNTLNLMLRALLHNGKYETAEMLCDAWDAQFGIKPDSNTEYIISQYLIELEYKESPRIKLPSSPTARNDPSNEASELKRPKRSLNVYGIQSPLFDLLDKLVFFQGKARFRLKATAWASLMSFLLNVEKVVPEPERKKVLRYPSSRDGLRKFIEFLKFTDDSYLPTNNLMTVYRMVEQVIDAGFPKDAINMAVICRRKVSVRMAPALADLELRASSMVEHMNHTVWRWEALRKSGVKVSDRQFFYYFTALAKRGEYRPYYVTQALKTLIDDGGSKISQWTLVKAYEAMSKIDFDRHAFLALDRSRRLSQAKWTYDSVKELLGILRTSVAPLLSAARAEEMMVDLVKVKPSRRRHLKDIVDATDAAKIEKLLDTYLPDIPTDSTEHSWYLTGNFPQLGRFYELDQVDLYPR